MSRNCRRERLRQAREGASRASFNVDDDSGRVLRQPVYVTVARFAKGIVEHLEHLFHRKSA